MRKILPLLIVLALLTSCKRADKRIIGTWALLEIYYGNTEISGNSSQVYLTPNLIISTTPKYVAINFNEKRPNLVGKFKLYNEDELDRIDISGFADERLNGTYDIELVLTRGTETSRNRTYEITLSNDSVYMRGTKTIATIL